MQAGLLPELDQRRADTSVFNAQNRVRVRATDYLQQEITKQKRLDDKIDEVSDKSETILAELDELFRQHKKLLARKGTLWSLQCRAHAIKAGGCIFIMVLLLLARVVAGTDVPSIEAEE